MTQEQPKLIQVREFSHQCMSCKEACSVYYSHSRIFGLTPISECCKAKATPVRVQAAKE